jgi:hypothetical protein
VLINLSSDYNYGNPNEKASFRARLELLAVLLDLILSVFDIFLYLPQVESLTLHYPKLVRWWIDGAGVLDESQLP